MGPTAWSFNRYSFFEAIDKTAALGMRYLEAFQGQRISPDSQRVLDEDLPEEVAAQIKEKLESAKVRLTSIYIHRIPGDSAGCRRVFELARRLRVEFIVSEPAPEALDTIEKFCQDYAISLAIHNHAKGKSRYWDPREVLRVCEGRGPRIGVCGDTGHWLRSNLDPVEAVKVLKSRLIALHLKDLNASNVDVPWGKGKGRIAEVLDCLHRLQIKPALIGIEYETDWENNLPAIAECGRFFKDRTRRWAKSPLD